MMIKNITCSATLLATLLMAGCQTSQGLYHWGDYETGLYSYYHDPAQQTALSEQLLQAIETGGARVPPGMYAEYGTLLLQQGKTEEAVVYYRKEKELWPESEHLMDAMINNLTPKANTQKEE